MSRADERGDGGQLHRHGGVPLNGEDQGAPGAGVVVLLGAGADSMPLARAGFGGGPWGGGHRARRVTPQSQGGPSMTHRLQRHATPAPQEMCVSMLADLWHAGEGRRPQSPCGVRAGPRGSALGTRAQRKPAPLTPGTRRAPPPSETSQRPRAPPQTRTPSPRAPTLSAPARRCCWAASPSSAAGRSGARRRGWTRPSQTS